MGWAARAKQAQVGPIRHAPWSRWFKTFYCNGAFAHEVQFGPWVFYMYHHEQRVYNNRSFRMHRDPYWRRIKYAQG